MTNTKHTPGPWSAHYNNEGLTVFSPDNVPVAYVDYDECEERPVEANAHLIAAAPAMYEALQIMVKAANVDEIDPLVMFASIERAKGVLAQAEGHQHG